MDTKICIHCQKEFNLTDFTLRHTKNGIVYKNICKICHKKYMKNYYKTNKEKLFNKYKIKRSLNLEEINAKRRERYKTDEKYRKHQQELNKKSKIKNYNSVLKGKKKYRELNKDAVKLSRIKHKQNHPEYYKSTDFKLKNSLRTRVRIALKSTGNKKCYKTMELIGCTLEFLKEYLEKQFLPGMTWENHNFYGWHIDHIIPCVNFDLTDPEQQKKCFHYTNLRPLWAKDNLSKKFNKFNNSSNII